MRATYHEAAQIHYTKRLMINMVLTGHLGIADPPMYVVKAVVLANSWLLSKL